MRTIPTPCWVFKNNINTWIVGSRSKLAIFNTREAMYDLVHWDYNLYILKGYFIAYCVNIDR